MLLVNEYPVSFKPGISLTDLRLTVKPDADLFIVNGYPVSADTSLQDGDRCWLIKRGEVPAYGEMERLLYARHTPGVHEKMKTAIVGVMGLGGLGSMVAVALARMGVGRLIIADYDVVEPTNLNRQQYFMDQIGSRKTAALKDNLARINPYVRVLLVDEELNEDSIITHFKDVDVLVECFDKALMKAAALRAVLTGLKNKGYVGASGLAGYGDNNLIQTRKLYPNVYVVGDGVSAAAPGHGLMAPRVGIAAHHQANQVVRLLIGETENHNKNNNENNL